jgi:hypothetical protein
MKINIGKIITNDELYYISLGYVLRHSHENNQSISVLTHSYGEACLYGVLDDPEVCKMDKALLFIRFIWLAAVDLFKTEVLSWKKWAMYSFLNMVIICYAYFWINDNKDNIEYFNIIIHTGIHLIPVIYIIGVTIKSMFVDINNFPKIMVKNIAKTCITIMFVSALADSILRIKNILAIPSNVMILSMYNIILLFIIKFPTRIWQVIELKNRIDSENYHCIKIEDKKIIFSELQKIIMGEFLVKATDSNWYSHDVVPIEFLEYYVHRIFLRNGVLAIILKK